MKCNRLHIIFLAAAAILLSGLLASCEQRELVDMGNTHYVRVYIDEHIKNVTEGIYNDKFDNPELVPPIVMKAALYDENSGEKVADRFLQNVGKDTRGYYVDGYLIAPPGRYKFMVYSFETEKTRFSNENNYSTVDAYTYPISRLFSTSVQSEASLD